MTSKGIDINRHFNTSESWDYENGFYLTSPVSRLSKTLNQFELYKRILQLPGDVLEFGVYKGASMAKLLTFREALETASSRRIIGFDAFGDFPTVGVQGEDDRDFIQRFETDGGQGFSSQEIASYLDDKALQNYELIAGDVRETLPQILHDRPHLRVALLHLDLDVYEPTRDVLDLLEDRLVPGALVMVDDYNAVGGATAAIDEFCIRHQLTIQKLPLSHVPAFLTWTNRTHSHK